MGEMIRKAGFTMNGVSKICYITERRLRVMLRRVWVLMLKYLRRNGRETFSSTVMLL